VSLRLYEIAEEFRRLDDAIDDADGELSAEVEAALDQLHLALADKVDALAALVRERDGKARFFADESADLARKARVQRHAADRLRDYLRRHLEALGLDGVQGARFTVAVQDNGTPSIRWSGPPDRLPDEFARVERSLDPAAARAALQDGRLPEGFDVVRGRHLRIR
jgi:hypothetical protein